MSRRYKTKRHNAPALRYDGRWLVYDSEQEQHLPVLIRRTRREAAEAAARFNKAGVEVCSGGETREHRDRRMARLYYDHERRYGFPLGGTYGEAHADAATRVTKEEAFRPMRALDIPI